MCRSDASSTTYFPPKHLRRRSADVGGLLLATGNRGQGHGWMDVQGDTRFAELLSDMYTETLNAVNEHDSEFVPTDLRTETRSQLIKSLDSWHFEPHKLPDDQVVACTLLLFEALYRIEGMEAAVGIPMSKIPPFVQHLRHIYRYENSYHNFEHALDVLQASHCYLQAAGMVPPLSLLLHPHRKWKSKWDFDSGPIMTCLGLQELFVVYIAAIGHDVGHPGFTNVFMKNAHTPLSVMFDGKSALEHMHCHLLLRVMRHHGLGALLDRPHDGIRVRKLLWQTVLATDMSVHNDFMTRFTDELRNNEPPCAATRGARQILICQAILKCADISNPSRPYPVSQHWAGALMQEWTSQALFEQHLALPPSVQPSTDPLTEAKSQVYFIQNFAKPLLDLVVQAVPEMDKFATQCNSNLHQWLSRSTELRKESEGAAAAASAEGGASTEPPPAPPPISPQQRDYFMTAFPMALPPSSWNSVDCCRSSSDSSSNSTESNPSNPCSPSSDSVTSFTFSPTSASESSISAAGSGRPPSSSGSSISFGGVNGVGGGGGVGGAHPSNGVGGVSSLNEGHAAIRAAGKLAPRKHKIINRNSWSPLSLVNITTTPSGMVIGVGGGAGVPTAVGVGAATHQGSIGATPRYNGSPLARKVQALPSPILSSTKGTEGTILMTQPIKLEKANSTAS
ncbi:HD-domain/PDEase-like protein [Pluteus cervinus]|uniref:HD-domain/PDEase-like protein n=1 Tax=Pluteus cervinus TaxID=181527 RepID=A0ACD3B353_9AGAR|nr:HD-domain/PDEase-like protein [Pluteus cervinus]